MKKFLLFAVSFTVLSSGCSKKEAPPPPPQAATTPSAPTAPAAPEPKTEFTDAAKQQQYEALFREYLPMFAAPEIGSYMWLTLTDGGLVLGLVEKIELSVDGNKIYIRTEHNTATLPADYLVEETRARVFQADFARFHAMARVKGESSDAGTPVAKPFARYPISGGIKPRVGPGIQYRTADSASFAAGGALTICSESRDWIEVQTEAKGVHLWIPRFGTYDLDELNLESRQRDIDVLTKVGVVQRVIPENNELLVEPGMWATVAAEVRQGIARAAAAYCAAVQKKTTIFLTVLDSKSQAKLGKYSSRTGWVEALP
jgi:hypothetical protein